MSRMNIYPMPRVHLLRTYTLACRTPPASLSGARPGHPTEPPISAPVWQSHQHTSRLHQPHSLSHPSAEPLRWGAPPPAVSSCWGFHTYTRRFCRSHTDSWATGPPRSADTESAGCWGGAKQWPCRSQCSSCRSQHWWWLAAAAASSACRPQHSRRSAAADLAVAAAARGSCCMEIC